LHDLLQSLHAILHHLDIALGRFDALRRYVVTYDNTVQARPTRHGPMRLRWASTPGDGVAFVNFREEPGPNPERWQPFAVSERFARKFFV
jgi:hypothetical protein